MKILIINKNWLGDILFQLPAIEAVKAHYPAAEIVCMAPARCKEILEACPSVSRVLIFDEKNSHRNIFKRFAFAAALNKEGFDKVYLFHRSKTRAFLALCAGIKERIGFDNGRGFLLTKHAPEPSKNVPLHHVDYFIELIKIDGVAAPSHAVYRFHARENDKVSAEKMMKDNNLVRYVCFHLGANWEPKRWPVSHFAALADMIAEKWNADIVVTGSQGDKDLSEKFLELVKKARVVSLTGKTNLGEAAAIFQKAQWVISGDSGPMHIASGVGARLVALFGPTDPRRTGPRGVGKSIVLSYVPPGYSIPWYGREVPEWLSNIKPEQVIEAIENEHWNDFPGRQAVPNLNPPKILLVTLTNIGDVIINTAVLMSLKTQFPDSHITVVTSPKGEGVLKGSRFIDRMILYDKRASLMEKLNFLKEIRSDNYDYAIDLKNTAIPFLINAKHRSKLFRHRKNLTLRDHHLDVLKDMKLNVEQNQLFDFFGAEEEVSVLEKLRAKSISAQKDWIVIAPIAASELKTWKLEGFREVIEKLLREQEEPIFLVGGEREKSLAEPLTALDPLRVWNLAGETSLRELAFLLSRANLVIAHDSSVLHLAYEMDRPAVGIFGPTDHTESGRFGPHFRIVRAGSPCSPCMTPSCRFDRQHCFEDLKSDQVFSACRELLHVHSH